MKETTPSWSPPGQQPSMARDVLSTFDSLSGITVYQESDYDDGGCCFFGMLPFRYKISALPSGAENVALTNRDFQNLLPLFEAREKLTSSYGGVSTSPLRPFKIGLFDPDIPSTKGWPPSNPMLLVDRPNSDSQLNVLDEGGRLLGRVKQDFRCYEFCCKLEYWAKSFNPDDEHTFSFKTAYCGENCCAPTCCNEVFTIHVLDSATERNSLGVFKSIFPGCNWRSLCSSHLAKNLVIVFPPNATKEEKGVFLGALFLHDFIHFQNDPSNNH